MLIKRRFPKLTKRTTPLTQEEWQQQLQYWGEKAR